MATKDITIKVIHGPNLNMLGTRESAIYGDTTLEQINSELAKLAQDQNIALDCFQSNHEGAIVDYIQESADCSGILINPAAYTHTSIAIRDALLAIDKPFVEVHLSDVKKREKFRKTSYYSDVAINVVSGLGAQSYYLGFQSLIDYIKYNET